MEIVRIEKYILIMELLYHLLGDQNMYQDLVSSCLMLILENLALPGKDIDIAYANIVT